VDVISESRLGEIHQLLASKIRTMAEMLSQESITIRVTQGLRSWNQQQDLYSQGRDADGNIIGKTVTNAKPGYSWHNFGLAVDVAPFDNGIPDWNENHPDWQRIVQIGTSLGLTAGAGFRTFPDYPHFQLTGIFPVTPTDEVRQLFRDGGVSAVWDEAKIAA